MGLSRIFDISRRSLATYQNSMNIASHNISNAANKNYTRQRVNLAAENPETNANFVWGTGIKLDSITRVRDGLVDKQLIANQQNYSFNEKQSLMLSQIEQVFSEPSELGISNLMNNFFNTWNELSVNPNSIPLRNNVIYAAENLATKVDSINRDIDTIKYDMFREFQEKTDTLNSSLNQVTQLNKQIFQATATGLDANDLMDQRDKIIGDLSKLVNLSVNYDNNGSANISIGGVFAADGAAATEFEVVNDNGKLTIAALNTSNHVQLKAGEIAAIADIYSNKIPDYQNDLDYLFTEFVRQVNTVHSSGYTIESTPRTGIDFFKEYKDGKLVISDDILNSPENIAVSADGTDGNGDISVQLADLSTSKTINGASFNSYYNSLISKLGNDKLSVDRQTEANQMILDQLQLQKQSISGVSVDEEMTEIIKYQRAYDASAKLIRIADEMLETIMGLV
jgi:flagellar hook-associated protein 1 FlgK